MKKDLTELVMILDRSGSMQGLEADTIGGFNGMIEKQKKEEGECLVSAVLFDDRAEVLYDRVPIGRVERMTDRQYYVRGCTALLDALGSAIHHIGNIHKYARREDVPEKTIFVIITDGMENASRAYSYDRVRRMIERQQEKYHWEFLFLGANIDAIAEAARFGIRASHTANYVHDSEGTALNFDVLSGAISSARAAKSARDMNAMFDSGAPMERIREDYARRKRGRKN
ncbi:MAG: VWA domain-containing protein [Eubacteriales bacterium]|nr:VWA domain-containing protein [Eubacteriales bacterium]